MFHRYAQAFQFMSLFEPNTFVSRLFSLFKRGKGHFFLLPFWGLLTHCTPQLSPSVQKEFCAFLITCQGPRRATDVFTKNLSLQLCPEKTAEEAVKKWRLEVWLRKTSQDLGLGEDSQVFLGFQGWKAEYCLKHHKTGAVETKGALQTGQSFPLTQSFYSRTTMQEEIERQTLKLLAQKIFQRLLRWIHDKPSTSPQEKCSLQK